MREWTIFLVGMVLGAGMAIGATAAEKIMEFVQFVIDF